jgi:hypothetical protein
MTAQLEFFRTAPKATDANIDWDSVTGLDLANDISLAKRWEREVNRPFARRINKWRRRMKNSSFSRLRVFAVGLPAPSSPLPASDS